MLDNWQAPIPLDIAIICTALAWSVGFYAVAGRVYIFQSLAICAFVCLIFNLFPEGVERLVYATKIALGEPKWPNRWLANSERSPDNIVPALDISDPVGL